MGGADGPLQGESPTARLGTADWSKFGNFAWRGIVEVPRVQELQTNWLCEDGVG